MKQNLRWLMGVLLIWGLWTFVACANDDNPIVEPTEQLQDGEWTGSGEGRSGTIIVKVTGGLHGANRLGGNGVADIVVNGRLAGIAAAQKVKK